MPVDRPINRRTLVRLGALAPLATVAGCFGRAPATPPSGTGLDALFAGLEAELSPDGPYRDPRRSERRTASEALRDLMAAEAPTGRVDDLLGGLGFAVTHGTDTAPGRREYTLYFSSPQSEPAWGGLLVDRSAPIRSVIEVPHPGSDRNTELLGLSLFRRLPGTILMFAGAHRKAAGGAGDVAHNEDSLFQLASREYARSGLPQLQLHGFAEESLPGADFVASGGAAPRTGPLDRVAEELTAAGYRVCRAWSSHCTGLEGTTNVQSAAAAEFGSAFIHLETGWPLRRDAASRDGVVAALVRAWRGD